MVHGDGDSGSTPHRASTGASPKVMEFCTGGSGASGILISSLGVFPLENLHLPNRYQTHGLSVEHGLKRKRVEVGPSAISSCSSATRPPCLLGPIP
jgi:hypothetical protein